MTLTMPLNHDEPRCVAALDAERRLFEHYGLSYRQHIVQLSHPALRLRVLEIGEGPPLLMVPGGAGDAAFFAALVAELEGWRAIVVNRPGGGLSDGLDHRLVNVRQLAVDTLRTVADHFQLPPAPLICNSMGGLWGFWYALAQPQRVSRMVQLGCPALLLGTSAPFFMRLLGVPVLQNLVAPQMQPQDVGSALEGLRFQGSRQEDIDRLPPEMVNAAYCFFNLPTYLPTWKTLVSSVATVRGARPRYRLEAEALRTVQCPVQFIWGDNDPFGGLDVARRAAEMMPDARLHEMRAGHLPFLDRPEETGLVIRAFLDGERESARFRATTPATLPR